MIGVSIIICTYNSEKIIAENLKHFLAQEKVHFPWEIIIVNNNCTDHTVNVINKNSQGLNLRIVDEEKPGLSYARNTGINEANFPIISFIDDDNFVPTNWIKYIGKVFSENNIGILGVTAVGDFNFEPEPWFANYSTAFAVGALYKKDFSNISNLGLVYGAGMTLKKEIYTQLNSKGWQKLLTGRKGNTQSSGEDSEICLAAKLLGYDIYYSNEINIKHHLSKDRISLDRLKKLSASFGVADVYLLPYEIAFRKKINQSTLTDALRKNIWFNILGKKLSYLKTYIGYKLGKIDSLAFEIFALRNKAFIKELQKNKQQFKEAFTSVNALL